MGKVAVIAAVAALCGCVAQADEGEHITRACVRSFATTLAAWEEVSGQRVPAECSLLDIEYDVIVVDDDAGIPCAGEPRSGLLQVGCTLPEQRAIYILQRDPLAMVDTSVHEWIHALADCVLGDPDAEHLRAGLWIGRNGAVSTEAHAAAAAQTGECR